MWIGAGIIGVAVLILVARFFIVPAISPMPDNLGWQDDGFAPCPSSRSSVTNCVSSTADQDTPFSIAPLSFDGSAQKAHDALIRIINDMPRSTIITDNENYIHAEFQSLMWGFIDDTEFYIDGDNQVVHVRSAARLGEGDMGVNRNRIESIRTDFEG